MRGRSDTNLKRRMNPFSPQFVPQLKDDIIHKAMYVCKVEYVRMYVCNRFISYYEDFDYVNMQT